MCLGRRGQAPGKVTSLPTPPHQSCRGAGQGPRRSLLRHLLSGGTSQRLLCCVVTQSLLTILAVFVYLGTLDFFFSFFFFLTRNLNHILFEIFQKDVAMWLPFYKLLNETVSGSQLCLKNNGFGAQASLLRTQRTVTKAKNPVQSWLAETCSGKSRESKWYH